MASKRHCRPTTSHCQRRQTGVSCTTTSNSRQRKTGLSFVVPCFATTVKPSVPTFSMALPCSLAAIFKRFVHLFYYGQIKKAHFNLLFVFCFSRWNLYRTGKMVHQQRLKSLALVNWIQMLIPSTSSSTTF